VIMPGINGRELSERLLAQRPSLKVLFMSGYPDDAILRHGGLGSGKPFLEKPFSPDALVRKVLALMDDGDRPGTGRSVSG
jgi:two-component system cell cycle sensor histidine kinase/response regulator CckA